MVAEMSLKWKGYDSEVPHPCNSGSEVTMLCDSSREALLFFRGFCHIKWTWEQGIQLSLDYSGLSWPDRSNLALSLNFLSQERKVEHSIGATVIISTSSFSTFHCLICDHHVHTLSVILKCLRYWHANPTIRKVHNSFEHERMVLWCYNVKWIWSDPLCE